MSPLRAPVLLPIVTLASLAAAQPARVAGQWEADAAVALRTFSSADGGDGLESGLVLHARRSFVSGGGAHYLQVEPFVRLDPEDEAGTLALGEAWAAAHAPPGEAPIADGALLREALQLAGHLLSEISPPGNLLTLLELTRRHRQSHDLPPKIALEDLLDTLSALSGLPRSVLDDRRPLDLSSVRERFERAVVGQRDAVDCLRLRPTHGR